MGPPGLVQVSELGDPPDRIVNQAEQQRLLSVWSKHVRPTMMDGTADFEDFFEQAARLDAAVQAFGENRIWLYLGDATKGRNLATGETRLLDRLRHLPVFGSQITSEALSPANRVERLADGYMDLAAFQRSAGRRMILADHDGELDSELVTACQDLGAADGQVFVKSAFPKSFAGRVHLTDPSDSECIFSDLVRQLAWTMVQDRRFLVQELITMRYEYRFFVVDGRLVTGAGCIKEFTPLNNDLSAFDTVVREHRREHSARERRPDIVARLYDHACGIVRDIAVERPQLNRYTLDMAIDERDRPLAIELNGLLNSGLYASQPLLLAKAMDRLYPKHELPTEPVRRVFWLH